MAGRRIFGRSNKRSRAPILVVDVICYFWGVRSVFVAIGVSILCIPLLQSMSGLLLPIIGVVFASMYVSYGFRSVLCVPFMHRMACLSVLLALT